MNRDDINLSNPKPGQVPGFEVGPFDCHDDDLMHDLLGNERLAKPVQDLCILAEQIKVTQDSYGVNAERLAQSVIPKLAALLKACREEYAED